MARASKSVPTGNRKSNSRAASAAPGAVRIIAGRWRGRKLAVPDVTGLRPTGDRVRETLFNWLQPHVAGARCLDLFAGSGALGFEALSRYAGSVAFVEPDSEACQALVLAAEQMGVNLAVDQLPGAVYAPNEEDAMVAQLYPGQAMSAIKEWQKSDEVPQFDLVFIDPPFHLKCQWSMLEVLCESLLEENALVYIESPVDLPVPYQLPAGCEITREKRFGHVIARLVRFSSTV